VLEGTPRGQPPAPVRVGDALAQAAAARLGGVRADGAGRRASRLPGTGPDPRLRTAQLGTSPCAMTSVGSAGASRPGSRLTA
jgi:hypothetical protein